MTDNIRLPDELGQQLRAARLAAGLSKTDLALKAGKMREVVYRLKSGDDSVHRCR
jgi:ribosome-binding protein aMBF1 (putative translation factor)